YCTKVTHRQYVPSAEEIELMVKNFGIEITGDPTEKYEVSQQKYLPRVETNQIRGGMALVLTEGPSLKAEKLWKQISKWGVQFGLENWSWLKEFIALKQKLHTVETKTDTAVKPMDTYLHDLVAGRPVFSYPMRAGGFRLRYGRCRLSGFAATAIHPATMQILNDYVATGTQIKTERPGKATIFNPCDTIEGPVVRLKDGSVLRLQDEMAARKIRQQAEKILYIGDLLISYGDFSETGQRLVPAGYYEEIWAQEALKSLEGKPELKEKYRPIALEHLQKKSAAKISAGQAIEISQALQIPLHPQFTYYWREISNADFLKLYTWFKSSAANEFPIDADAKRALELLACPHTVKNGKICFSDDDYLILKELLVSETYSGNDGLECINSISKIKIRDKAGTFIGTRMGRPEKAKLRKLKGTPVVLFPVGREGGRLRSFQEALEVSAVTSDFPIFVCPKCNVSTVYPVCEDCGSVSEKWRLCPMCKKKTKLAKCHTETVAFERKKIDLTKYFTQALRHIDEEQAPPLVKGVRGTWNKDHLLENLAKGMLRAKHNLAVNKDGTIRYDMTEMGCTHFKPKEVGTQITKLKELGYTHDKYGRPLENEDQVLEIMPQDVILPSCPEAGDETADDFLLRTCNFIDSLLEKFYKLPAYYKIKNRADLVGQLVVALAPHTSAGIIARVIGFSKTQGCFSHPYLHAACRRNLDGDEVAIMLALDALINFSRQYLPDIRGGRSMDAPLVLTTTLVPEEVDSEVHGLDIPDFYPLEFYEAAAQGKMPFEFKIEQIKDRLGKPSQYEGMSYSHEVSDLNSGVRVSAYKSIPTMIEKLEGQLELARKLKAVDFDDVARLVIDKHFIRDIKGNLRKFTSQEIRCITCNAKYRRVPLSGACNQCKTGKLVFTIAEGSIKKYLEASLKLAKFCPQYMQQSMDLLNRRIESIFGREATKQIVLREWFAK
ncbi:MAG: DNA polymerase II large subunit, partial [DPANN group archaeon]|nr:DNA polymerase II large subunit [DPANN group archaeon]